MRDAIDADTPELGIQDAYAEVTPMAIGRARNEKKGFFDKGKNGASHRNH